MGLYYMLARCFFLYGTPLLKSVRQPYIAVAVGVATILVVYMLTHHSLGVEKASFLLAMAMSAVFVSKACVLMQANAPYTSLWLFTLGLFIFAMALNYTAPEQFKDLVVEGLALQVAGQVGVYIDVALKRSKKKRWKRRDDIVLE